MRLELLQPCSTLDAMTRAPSSAPPASAAPLDADIDCALAQRAAAGDQTAFEVLVVKYQRRVAATIRALVRDVRVTEELTQDVFLRVHGALGDIGPGSHFRGWILTIARNAASSYLRSGQNRMDDRPVEPTPAADDVALDPLSRTDLLHPSAEDEAAARQLFALIDRSIAELPAAQRAALLLREIEDLDYRSVAAALGVPINTAKSHIFRARETIAARIRPLIAPTRNRRW
jgi:RNA polymerase sigma-70 factor (ECF subfamily)